MEPYRYDARLAGEIETRWQAYWDEHETFRQPNPGEPGFDPRKPRYYVLDMFPYPSGAGLHVGHPEGYTATDILARYKRMRGYNVLHPMGWDAYGLPAEQYAIQTGVHPAKTTRRAIETFRRQLKRFGFSYDWSREFGTIDEDYYRWTQWIFLQIYGAWFDTRANRARPVAELVEEAENGHLGIGTDGELVWIDVDESAAPPAGVRLWDELDEDARRDFIDGQRLAYVGEPVVNWCPKLGTVLANEEVIDGRSERGGHPVFRKPLKQWLFRITAYADRLLEGLDQVDWPESTRTQQAEWIGRSEGADIDFPIGGTDGDAFVRVYTTRPDTIFGATFMVVAPEHPVLARVDDPKVRAYVDTAKARSELERMETKEKTGVDTGLRAVNPATGETIPVWVADYVLMGYGHGAIMAVPGGDERDYDFARAYGLPVRTVVLHPDGSQPDGCYAGEGIAVNSSGSGISLDGLKTPEATRRIIAWLEEKGLGRGKVNTRLRDWLFSRQRYWGEPFPIVWDEHGRHHAVGEETLPVKLPPMEDFHPEESDEPKPLLAKARDWAETTAGDAGVADLPPDAPVERETNTMPGWAGSCWYYLRFIDPHNDERFVGEEAERYWMGERGVDLYIGGAEHAVLHLLYARFWHMVLYDLGWVSTSEPFGKLFHQGMITSHAYQRADKSLVPIDEVEERAEGVYVETATGAEVTRITAKMSKSLKNVVNPDDVIEEFGADTFRLYEMYMGALADTKPWNTRDTSGMHRFLQRVWRLAVDEETGETKPELADAEDGLPGRGSEGANDGDATGAHEDVERALHRAIRKAGEDIGKLHFNTAIAALIEFVNTAGKHRVTRDQMDRFVRVLAPFAPHMGEELWRRLGHEESVVHAPWPDYDEALLIEETIEIPVQVMGKVRARIEVAHDADRKTLEETALGHDRIRELIGGKTVRKVVVVPGRLVNIVAN